MRTTYYIAAFLAILAGLLAGLEFRHFYLADKSTVVAENAKNFVTLGFVAWGVMMLAAVSTILIVVTYLFGVEVDEYRSPHAVIAFFWLLGFILLMVTEIEIAKRDQDAGCIYHRTVGWSDEMCTSPWDLSLLGCYIITVCAFFEWVVFWNIVTKEDSPLSSSLSVMIGNRSVDISDKKAVREAVDEHNNAMHAEMRANIDAVIAQRQRDQIAAERVRDIHQLLGSGSQARPASERDPFRDLEAQAQQFHRT